MNGPVICGIDQSSVAAGAVEVARELAHRYDVPLVYAHVLDRDGDEEKTGRPLQIAVAADAEVVIEEGHPADRLVALAQEREASFLVVGNHGPRSSLLGSISADVSRRAPCPVVVVAPTAEITGQRRSGSVRRPTAASSVSAPATQTGGWHEARACRRNREAAGGCAQTPTQQRNS